MGIIEIIGGVLFLYLVWRRLKEDYPEERLIQYGWGAILAYVIGSRMFYCLINWRQFTETLTDLFDLVNKPGWSWGGGLLTMIVFSYIYSLINKWKGWAFLEDVGGLILLLMVFITGDKYGRGVVNWKMLGVTGIMFLGFLISLGIRGKYRSFWWYRSGKKGFGFFWTNFWVGWLLMMWSVWVVKWGLIWAVLFGGYSLVCLGGLFVIGEIWKKA